MNELPHLDDHGRSRMIDIGGKAITRRTAIATGRLDTTPAVLELLAANQLRPVSCRGGRSRSPCAE